jgi:hypothetical protein
MHPHLLARSIAYVRLMVLTAVTVKNAILSDVMPCGSCKNRSFRGSFASIFRVKRISELGTLAVSSN